MRRLGLLVVGLWVGLGWSSAALGDYIYIDSVLGYRAHYVDGLTAASSQSDVAQEATRLALAPEGWDLWALGGYARRADGTGTHDYSLDPTGALVQTYSGPWVWNGGVSWTAWGVPASASEDFGYATPACATCPDLFAPRHLIFHTDDVVTHGAHDWGEPSGFGTIVGSYADWDWDHLGQLNWGTFGVTPIPEPSTALLLGLGLVGIAARRRV